MNAAFLPTQSGAEPDAKAQHIDAACSRVAPTWPLDQFIAVNPYWGWLQHPIEHAAGALGSLAGSRLTLPRSWFQAEWAAGRLTQAHLLAAADHALVPDPTKQRNRLGQAQRSAQVQALADELAAALQPTSAVPPGLTVLPLMTSLRDAVSTARPGLSWTDMVTHQISQHCAAYFDKQQAAWGMDAGAGLYSTWCQQLTTDYGLPWPEGREDLLKRVQALPASPRATIAAALSALGIRSDGEQAYLSAVLLSIGGWAAWCAYLRWQARLGTAPMPDDDHIEQLLAIRLAWEWLLHRDGQATDVPEHWAAQWSQADVAAQAHTAAQRIDWLLQHAIEIAEQQRVIAGLAQNRDGSKSPGSNAAPMVQAFFCIDVRSEVFRRALEAADATVQTGGFAGFFGMPLAYQPLGTPLVRPQLPGLLAPTMQVTETIKESHGAPLAQVLAVQRQHSLLWQERWAAFRAAPSSGFSFVESLGFLYGAKLLRSSLANDAPARRWEDTGLANAALGHLRPTLPILESGSPSDLMAAGKLAHGVLTAMGLGQDIAPLVVLIGHGSQSANNPHAAGLDCGACGGQSGEVNARVLADLLNRPQVRAQVQALGIVIPPGTHFLPGLHNTTTDDVTLFDTESVPEPMLAALHSLQASLAAAGVAARAERAPDLGMGEMMSDAATLHRSVRERANDWSQVRPEWGLANNASFVIAPRVRTSEANLGGRSFLHDYDHRLDPEGKVLTLIMTAPMVVTNWINLQYHASTVDNRRYGSGNKLLHNVVGGHLGVFEGNGGDLRIGLPLQSLHDGERLRHTPLRLSVYIAAPQEAIESVMAAHSVVSDLVNNGWLHMFWLQPDGPSVAQWWRGQWRDALQF